MAGEVIIVGGQGTSARKVKVTDQNELLVTMIPSSPTTTAGVVILADETFPYTFPDATYSSAQIIVPTGETIDFNGSTLPEGTYNFSAGQGQTLGSFELDNPSDTPSGVIILTTI